MVDRITSADAKEEASFVDFTQRLGEYKPEEITTSIGNGSLATTHLSDNPQLTISATTADGAKTAVIATHVNLYLRLKTSPDIPLPTQKALDTAFQKTLQTGLKSGRITP